MVRGGVRQARNERAREAERLGQSGVSVTEQANVERVAPRIGVALSGGGHRAAVWGAGALLGLVDAGVNDRVVSVASVSGGSIANGLASARGTFECADRATVEGWWRPGLHQWSHSGLFFPGPPTDRWVAVTLGALVAAVAGLVAAVAASIAAARHLDDVSVLWVATGVAAGMLLLVGLFVARKMPASVLTIGVMVGAAASWPLTLVAAGVASASGWWLVLVWVVAVLSLLVAVRRFGRRSEIAADGLTDTLFAGQVLSGLGDRRVHHVFCATNLRTGNNLYLTNRLLWGYPNIAAEVPSIPLGTAVQASACLPGAFLARTMTLTDDARKLLGTVVLSDGGVYDNMADQWEWGFANRQGAAARLGAGELVAGAQPEGASHLVVVNASRGMGGDDETVDTSPGLGGELASVLGAKDVLYDVSTATRRRLLIDEFDQAHTHPELGGLDGMLVHIGTSPYQLVDAFASRGDERGARAVAARSLLDDLTDEEIGSPSSEQMRREWWQRVAAANSTVATTLAPLEHLKRRGGRGCSARLLHHAWILTRITAFVLHGWGTLPTSDTERGDWGHARFATLVADSAAGGP